MSNKKSPQEIAQLFQPRLAGVLQQLQQINTSDPEALWQIGSLASSLLKAADKQNWLEFKAALSPAAYDEALKALREQAGQLNAKGHQKAAFAAETIATSIIASRIGQREIALGNQLLDQIIFKSINGYRAAPAETPVIN